MSLERKDLRVKILPQAHEQLTALAEFHDKDISDMAAFLLERTLLGEGHAVRLLAERAHRWGTSGIGSGTPAASQGFSGKAVRAVR